MVALLLLIKDGTGVDATTSSWSMMVQYTTSAGRKSFAADQEALPNCTAGARPEMSTAAAAADDDDDDDDLRQQSYLHQTQFLCNPHHHSPPPPPVSLWASIQTWAYNPI